MPEYRFECPDCQIVERVFRRMADYDKKYLCTACGAEMKRTITKDTLPAASVWNPDWTAPAWDGPRKFASRGEFKKFCEDNQLAETK